MRKPLQATPTRMPGQGTRETRLASGGPSPILAAADRMLQRVIENPWGARPENVVQLQRLVGNRASSRLLADGARVPPAPGSVPAGGPRLEVTAAHHATEREADRVADLVTGRSGNAPDRAPAASPPSIMRELEGGTGVGVGGGEVGPEVASEIRQAKSGGQPLPSGLRSSLEQSFGADFDRVRVHTDDKADALSRSLQARAFTTGPDIFFKQGTFSPDSSEGRHLLAHELTHVVQQGHAGLDGGGHGAGPSMAQRSPDGLIQRELDASYTRENFVRYFPYAGKESLQMVGFLRSLELYRANPSQATLLRLRASSARFLQDLEDAGLFEHDGQRTLIQQFMWEVNEELQAFRQGNARGPNAQAQDADQVQQPPRSFKPEHRPAVNIRRRPQVQAKPPPDLSSYDDDDIAIPDLPEEQLEDLQSVSQPMHPAPRQAIHKNPPANVPQRDIASHSPNNNVVPYKQRKRHHFGMGYGAVGHLEKEVLSSTGFLTCSPVVMYNAATKIGGLFHFPAGQFAKYKKQMQSMYNEVRPTEVWVFLGSGEQSGGLSASGQTKLYLNDRTPLVHMIRSFGKNDKVQIHEGPSVPSIEVTLLEDGQIWQSSEVREVTEADIKRWMREKEVD